MGEEIKKIKRNYEKKKYIYLLVTHTIKKLRINQFSVKCLEI